MNTETLENWASLAEYLNQTIRTEGYIRPNNREMWRQYFHQWNNQHWTNLILALYSVYEQEPRHFRPNHLAAMTAAAETLDRMGYLHSRLLDMRSHKHHAWRLAMVLREVWNSIHGIKLANPTP